MILKNLGVRAVSDGMVAFVNDQKVDTVQMKITLVQEVQKNLVNHDKDIINAQHFVPFGLVPVVNIVSSAERLYLKWNVTGDEFGLLGYQRNAVHQENGLLALALTEN